jgi:hypothetical protein
MPTINSNYDENRRRYGKDSYPAFIFQFILCEIVGNLLFMTSSETLNYNFLFFI